MSCGIARPISPTGDYYDFFDRQDGRAGVFIGDGSGHGPSACMLMATMRALLRTHPALHGLPGATLAAAGVMFRELIPSDSFMTRVVTFCLEEESIELGRRRASSADPHPARRNDPLERPGPGRSAAGNLRRRTDGLPGNREMGRDASRTASPCSRTGSTRPRIATA